MNGSVGGGERRDDALDRLRGAGILAIVRYRAGGDLPRVLATIVDAGVRCIEVTTNTPGWQDAVVAETGRSDALIGVGTVTGVDQVAEAADLGARFTVSPGFDSDVVRASVAAGLETLPGVATASEVMAARSAGARILKLFPAGALGTDYLRQLRGPFAEEIFAATGGIGIDEVATWHAAGAEIVSLGSDLTGSVAPSTPEEWRALADRASRAAGA